MANTPSPVQQRFIDAAKRRAEAKNKPPVSTASRFVKAEQARKSAKDAKASASAAAVHVPSGASGLQGKFIKAEQERRAKPSTPNRPGGGYQHSGNNTSLAAARRAEAKGNQGISPSDTSSRAKSNENAFWQYRANRQQKGKFKGKYYGPDEFKGDTTKLSKWRAAGSPKDKSKFV